MAKKKARKQKKPASSPTPAPPKTIIPEPLKPLPSSTTGLERLVQRLDDLIDAVQAAVRQEGLLPLRNLVAIHNQHIPGALRPGSVKRRSLVSQLRKLEGYLDPTVLDASWHRLETWITACEKEEASIGPDYMSVIQVGVDAPPSIVRGYY